MSRDASAKRRATLLHTARTGRLPVRRWSAENPRYAAGRSSRNSPLSASRPSACSSSRRTLGGQPEPRPSLARRGRLVAQKPEAQRDHVALVLGQPADDLADPSVTQGVHHLFLRVGAFAGKQVAQRGLAVLPDALVEARQVPGQLEGLAHLILRQPGRLRDLGVGRLAPSLTASSRSYFFTLRSRCPMWTGILMVLPEFARPR